MANITSKDSSKFFSQKTVMRPYFFKVSFSDLYAINDTSTNYKIFKNYVSGFLSPEDVDNNSFKLQPFHVKSISVPEFSFNKGTVVKYGPFARAIPSMTFDGYELKIDLEEDESGTIKRFINYLQARIVHRSGIFWPINFAEIPYVELNVLNQTTKGDEDDIIIKYRFNGITLLQATEATYTYSDNQPMSYSLTFNCNNYDFEFYKKRKDN